MTEGSEYISLFVEHLRTAVMKHGVRRFNSTHEAYGVLAEEVHEVLHAVQSNIPEDVVHELLDVMVVAFWGIKSIIEGNSINEEKDCI